METISLWFKTDEEREQKCREICAAGQFIRGREGHEYWRRLGEIRHIYTFLMKDKTILRLIGLPQRPGMFSHLEEMEKQIKP